MNTKKPTLAKLTFLFCFFLLSCVHQESVSVKRLSSKTYSPTRYLDIMTQPPKRKYYKIAELNARGAEGTPKTEIIGALAMKARELGAQGLIIEDKSIPIANPFVMNTAGGMYDTNLNRTVPYYHAIAFRYAEE
ncbi:hypothetical protein IT6_06955 [Methylacidiphilum caldifontis]|uniref:hypothetical protein n=1 Tax=Methylacidiphilum caldifontis TaxID=2795386 RepID=UPI001A8C7975|nr:hypothetical protein [Methylacidiphilum caldifontis]QSR88122.1 hypothetical protein IT6_06955 [Methylacidiphilum caldifontis]